jgi:hypothetical protein
MAVLFYKWLILIFFQWGLPGQINHPFHVSVIEINHNAANKTLEISCKIFTDDFEDALTRKYKTRVDLVHPKDKPAMDKIVNDYLNNHLSIKTDSKATALNYIGFEVENEAVYIYMQVNDITSIKKADVTDTVLHDLFNDQTEIIHFIENGTRKSVKIDYPVSIASFQF